MAARLLLVGAGHPHLFVLEALARRVIPGAEVLLVAPHPMQLYAGMIGGYLAGRHALGDLALDLPAMARAAGGRLIEATVTGISAQERFVELADGTRLPYDVASVAIGGEAPTGAIPGVREHAHFLRPAGRAIQLWDALRGAAEGRGPEPLQVVVVGASASGFEVALAVRARFDRLGASRAIISLVDSTHAPLRECARAAQEEARAALHAGEISLRLSTGVEEVGPGHMRVTGGRIILADLVIWTADTEAPNLFRASGLPTDSRGFLTVDETLAVPGCPGLHGAGGAVSLESAPRAPRSGSQILRQGPVLAHNLRQALRAGPGIRSRTRGRSFRAAAPTLTLLDTGWGEAIVAYGAGAATTRWAAALKDWLDRRLVRRFRGNGDSST